MGDFSETVSNNPPMLLVIKNILMSLNIIPPLIILLGDFSEIVCNNPTVRDS